MERFAQAAETRKYSIRIACTRVIYLQIIQVEQVHYQGQQLFFSFFLPLEMGGNS